MCNHKKTNKTIGDLGTKLEHGKAHAAHHNEWNRRKFLSTGLLSAAGTLLINNIPISSLNANPLMAALNSANSDNRVLVLINLGGGNDGLNTLIPSSGVNRNKYELFRQATKWSSNELAATEFTSQNFSSGNMALNPHMEPLVTKFWQNDALAVVPNVGYQNESLSHFTSTKIWESAANNDVGDERWGKGWYGRYLDDLYPAFLEAPPSCPPALQIGYNGNLVFNNDDGLGMGLIFKDAEEFYQFALSGKIYSTNENAVCPDELQINYVRQVANSSFRYADTVKKAYNTGANDVDFTTDYNKGLNKQLAIISRLIKGKLGTKVYLVSLPGFDTHHSYVNGKYPIDLHNDLLNEVAASVEAFYEDLKKQGIDQNVVTMTYSEFGRTMDARSDGGTDHGTLAPVFLFGQALNPGFFGEPIQLENFDVGTFSRSPRFEDQIATDFRSIYKTLLRDWLCIDGNLVDILIGQDANENIITYVSGLIANTCSPDYHKPAALLGHNYSQTNPAAIDVKYAILKKGMVRLSLIDSTGNKESLMSEFHEAGSFIYSLDRLQNPPGDYDYILETGGKEYKRRVAIYP